MCDIAFTNTPKGDKGGDITFTNTPKGDKGGDITIPQKGYQNWGCALTDQESALLIEGHDSSSSQNVVDKVIKITEGVIKETEGSFHDELPVVYIKYTYEPFDGYKLTVTLKSPTTTAKATFLHSTYEEDAKAFFDDME